MKNVLLLLFTTLFAVTSCKIDSGMALNSDEAHITAFTIEKKYNTELDEDVDAGNITGTNINITVPFGTDVTKLVASFTVSKGATVTVDGYQQTSGKTIVDFSDVDGVTYTVTAQDETSTQNYTVKVTEATASSECEITEFLFEGDNNEFEDNVTAENITGTNINITVPFGTDVTKLVATFTVSEGASVTVDGNQQTSGETMVNFTNAVTYTVTAEDGNTKDYTVTVTEATASSECEIMEFAIEGVTDINISDTEIGGTITGNAVYGTKLHNTAPSVLNISKKAVIDPIKTAERNFNSPVTYTVTAEDESTTKEYTVDITVQQPATNLMGYTGTGRIGAGDLEKPGLFIVEYVTNEEWSCKVKVGGKEGTKIVTASNNQISIDGSILTPEQWTDIANNSDTKIEVTISKAGFDDCVMAVTADKEQYKVRTWQDLQGMEHDLTADYTLENHITFPNPNEDGFPAQGFTPIGAYTGFTGNELSFIGTFDGQNHVISNFFINRPDTDTVGLFGYAMDWATISNVGVETSSRGVTGGRIAGVLTGNNNKVNIHNCYVVGNVTANNYAGGLAGVFGGDMSNCYSKVDVTCITGTGRTFAGGLIGLTESRDTNIENSYATGNVIGRNRVGGLVGMHGNGFPITIKNCYARGNVEVKNVITDYCYVGGLVGENFGKDRSTIINSYATGFVKGDNLIAGNKTGGVVGYDKVGIIRDVRWDIETTGQSQSHGTYGGNTTEEMKNKSTFEYEWDFSTVWDIDDTGVINDGYPFLRDLGGQ